MATHQNQNEQETGGAQGHTAAGNEGPSYSSSYNESQPGESIENRREALHDAETDDDQPRTGSATSSGSHAQGSSGGQPS